jgi:hypothetical protein
MVTGDGLALQWFGLDGWLRIQQQQQQQQQRQQLQQQQQSGDLDAAAIGSGPGGEGVQAVPQLPCVSLEAADQMQAYSEQGRLLNV